VADDRGVIQQAYRFALDVTPAQEEFLLRCTGATRFFFNWGLALVKERLDARERGEDVRVPWSYQALCSEFAHVKDEVAPWRREVVCGSQQAGLEQLGRALQNFSAARRAGRRVGFPRFRGKGRCREVVIFQRPRVTDSRHVEFDRRLGPARTRERMSKLQRLLGTDAHARVLRATVSRVGRRWYVSFQVQRSPKQRAARRPNAVVGVDVGLRSLAALSTGDVVANARPLGQALVKLRRLQRQLDRQRRAANPGNYRADGTVRPGPKQWARSRRMLATEAAVRRLHERVGDLRREAAHELTTSLTREFGVVGVESLNIHAILRSRRFSRHVADAGWGLILQQLQYKLDWSGGTLVSADRYYPSSKTCSACATVKPKLSLSERVFTCDACGLRLDRDENAARNLAVLAAAVTQAEGMQTYVARVGRETLNARGGQVSPEPRLGLSPLKREGSLTVREPAQHRKALAVATG
jgi:putative transposase